MKKAKNIDKSPLRQEKPIDPPTYKMMPKCNAGSCKPYKATKQDSTDYVYGFNKPRFLPYTNFMKNMGRIEGLSKK